MQKTLNKELLCNAPQGSIEFSVDSTVQSAKGYIEYIVKLRVEDVEYEIGRRFSEFQDLDKNLRYHFPAMEFPALPSKYALFNKIEQRKKCFHSYMQGLTQVLDLIASDQRATLLKLLSVFLKLDGIIEATDENQSRSRNSSSVDLMQFPIGTRQYQGWSDVNLDGQWKHFYVSLKSDSLYLHQNNDLSDFMYQINLLLGRIELGPDDTFGLHHDHQKSPILFRSQNPDLRSALVIVCSSYTDSPLSQFKKSSVGRVCVTIHTGNNLRFAKPPVSLVKPHIYVSVDLDSVSCSTRPVPQSESLYWGQSFIL